MRRIGTFGACLYNARPCLFLHVEEFYFLLFILILSDAGRQPAPVRSADVNYRFHSQNVKGAKLQNKWHVPTRSRCPAIATHFWSRWCLATERRCELPATWFSGRFWTMHEMAGAGAVGSFFLPPRPETSNWCIALPTYLED